MSFTGSAGQRQNLSSGKVEMSPRGAGKTPVYTKVNKIFKQSKPFLRGKHVGESSEGAYENLS